MRPFNVDISGEALSDLERRLRATRWTEGPLAEEESYGATVSFTHRLCDHWLERFDWRALEARINAQPNFLVEIDSLSLHLIHRRSSRPDAIPLLLLHGWPTSVLEFLHLCDELAEPEGDAPAFHVVLPSLPGYGFSQTRAGISPRKIAELFGELMQRLGYERYIVQGGNWGSSIGTQMARALPERVIGLHLNAVNGSPPPEGTASLSEGDRAIAETYATVLSYPHFNLLVQTPLSVAHAFNDSPAGLAAWFGERLIGWADPRLPDNPGLDWIIGTIALYWLTGTSASSAMLYREAALDPLQERYVTVPTGVAHFAAETVMIPRPWAERHYNIVRWTRHDYGGHYPAIEVPGPFTEDVRSFANALCSGEKAD